MGMDAPFLSGTEASEANNGTGATFEAASAGFRNCLERVPANTDGSGFPGVARPARRHGMEIRNARSRPQASDGICRRPRTVLLRCRDRYCALQLPRP